MAGAWELINHEQVLTVILTRETVSTAWAFGFHNLHIPGTFMALAGMPFDHARNNGCQKLLEMGWDWLFFLDDDVIPPPDTIHRLVSHRLPIISGVYYRRSPPLVPVMLKETNRGSEWYSEIPTHGLMEVDYVGAGCLLIHRDVLTKLPPLSPSNHWFEWRVDRPDLPEPERMSEDFTFCRHARNHGFKIMVDTAIRCRHAGQSECRDGQLLPLEIV